MLLVFIVLAVAVVAQAQRRTVTNVDLERYRQERVQAEDALRQEYARNGISYDEVMRRNKESQKDLMELAAKLRAERLERERAEAEREQAMWLAAAARANAQTGELVTTSNYADSGVFPGSYYYGYGYGGRRRVRFGAMSGYTQPGYFAGGQFWSTGPITPPRPAWSVPGRHR
jgi:hypothetical protein